jgi:DNA modification methylase
MTHYYQDERAGITIYHCKAVELLLELSNRGGVDVILTDPPYPVELPRRLISRTPGELVLDPFCGVGSTLRAAKDLGRRAIGCEIDESACEIAARKMQQESLPLVARKNTLDAELGLA